MDLKPLTSLRFVAALLVFFDHLPPTRAFAQRYHLGEAGVGFFFLLSGFILTYTYHQTFSGAPTARAVRSFHLARVARIYPVHLVTMALCLAWLLPFGDAQWNASTGAERIVAILSQLVLLQSWSPNGNIYGGVNVVSWTISVEALFYLLFPLMLWGLLRACRAISGTRVLVGAGTMWLVALAITVSVRPSDEVLWALKFFPPSRLIEFSVGMMLAVAFLRMPRRTRNATRVESSALIAAALAIAALPMIAPALRISVTMMPFWGTVLFLFAAQAGAVSTFLSLRWCVRLGEASFAFYMVHYVVLLAENRVFGWSNVPLSSAIGFAVSLAASFALFEYVETPMRRIIRGWSNRVDLRVEPAA